MTPRDAGALEEVPTRDLDHEEVCAILHAQGFRLGRFAVRLAQTLSEPRWRNDGEVVVPGDEQCHDELIEELRQFRLRPDAYRIRVEGREHGWNHDVLVCDVIEVVHTSPPSAEKMELYDQLWWYGDGSECLTFRFWQTSHGKWFSPICPSVATALAFASGIPLAELLDFHEGAPV